MKSDFTFLLLLGCFTIFAQRFEIVSAAFEGEVIPVTGEVFIDVAKKSIALKINE